MKVDRGEATIVLTSEEVNMLKQILDHFSDAANRSIRLVSLDNAFFRCGIGSFPHLGQVKQFAEHLEDSL